MLSNILKKLKITPYSCNRCGCHIEAKGWCEECRYVIVNAANMSMQLDSSQSNNGGMN